MVRVDDNSHEQEKDSRREKAHAGPYSVSSLLATQGAEEYSKKSNRKA